MVDEVTVDIWLTDDGCIDGTANVVADQFPEVHIVSGDGTLFWNRGMHKAWKAAASYRNYDYYLWLNDDTILMGTALSNLMTSSCKHNDQSIIVGATKTSSGEPSYGGRNENMRLIPVADKEQKCRTFNGNIVLIPRDVFEKIGFNDPCFRHALGDFDYGLRAAKMGVEIIVPPGFQGMCELHESLSTWCDPKKTLRRRLKAFYSPLGNNPNEYFIFSHRHQGLMLAIFHYITNYVRVLIPGLWTFVLNRED